MCFRKAIFLFFLFPSYSQNEKEKEDFSKPPIPSSGKQRNWGQNLRPVNIGESVMGINFKDEFWQIMSASILEYLQSQIFEAVLNYLFT